MLASVHRDRLAGLLLVRSISLYPSFAPTVCLARSSWALPPRSLPLRVLSLSLSVPLFLLLPPRRCVDYPLCLFLASSTSLPDFVYRSDAIAH